MRIFALALAAMTLFVPAAAHACRCAAPEAGQAEAILADPSLSYAEVLVRGANPANRQSMLEIKNVKHGGLVANNIRAKFGETSCAVVPVTGQTRTVLIKAEEDATYSIVSDCNYSTVKTYFEGK